MPCPAVCWRPCLAGHRLAGNCRQSAESLEDLDRVGEPGRSNSASKRSTSMPNDCLSCVMRLAISAAPMHSSGATAEPVEASSSVPQRQGSAGFIASDSGTAQPGQASTSALRWVGQTATLTSSKAARWQPSSCQHAGQTLRRRRSSRPAGKVASKKRTVPRPSLRRSIGPISRTDCPVKVDRAWICVSVQGLARSSGASQSRRIQPSL